MDGDGFETWYLAEHPRLINSLYAVSGSVEAAREATDEAFVRALERWPQVSAMASPTGWTYRVGLNVLRRSMRRHAQEGRVVAQGRRAEVVDIEVPQPHVWAAVAALSLRHRQVLVLRYVADFSEQEIADVLGIRRGTAASDLSRARVALAAVLADDPATRPDRATTQQPDGDDDQ
jgi:RNA polymerase sigma factor (sigma-70 family)